MNETMNLVYGAEYLPEAYLLPNPVYAASPDGDWTTVPGEVYDAPSQTDN